MAKGILAKISKIFSGRKKDLPKETIKVDKKNETEPTESPIEDDKHKPAPEENLAPPEDLADIVAHVITPEERTLKNYLSLKFWKEQYKEFNEIRIKEREDLNVFEVLSEGAKPSNDYYILTILSSVIATIGLIQGSTAIIIGAMIIAPLMTPILTFSLAVIWGNLKLIRVALVSIIKGTLWALIISSAIAFLVPIPEYSFEITSRTVPSLFDILVAITSGIVGAYGYANKKISNTIIGIAIAVALLPPLCTIGIGLGTFNKAMASGASILFIINLISIGLSGSIVFWWMKIHPVLADKGEVKKRALSQIFISISILAAISIPVGIFMYDNYQVIGAEKEIRTIVKKDFKDIEIFKLNREKSEDGITINLIITGDRTLSDADEEKIKQAKKKFIEKYKNISELKIRYIIAYPLSKKPSSEIE